MSMTAKRARELEAEIGRLDFGRDPPPCLDEACEYLRAYADSLERASNEPEAAPHGWLYQINGAMFVYSPVEPPSDAYDEGTLTPLYARPAPPPPDVQRDAERYRALREIGCSVAGSYDLMEAELDDWADAARTAQTKKGAL